MVTQDEIIAQLDERIEHHWGIVTRERAGRDPNSAFPAMETTTELKSISAIAALMGVKRWIEQQRQPSKDAYIVEHVERLVYNPAYGDDRECICGHPYYRHFDSYDNNEPVGCKYCACFTFVEKGHIE